MNNTFNTSFGTFLKGTDYISNWMEKNPDKMWDGFLLDVFQKYINKDDCVIEVGANVGAHTITLSKLAKKVYSFEPQKFIFLQLCGNLFLNKCLNVQSFNKVVADSERLFSIEKDIDYLSQDDAPRLQFLYSEKGEKSVTIDSFNIPCNFLKIDAQGCDLLVLQGAIETITKYKPVIVLEIEEEAMLSKFQTTKSDYINFFNYINYSYSTFIPNGADYLLLPK